MNAIRVRNIQMLHALRFFFVFFCICHKLGRLKKPLLLKPTFPKSTTRGRYRPVWVFHVNPFFFIKVSDFTKYTIKHLFYIYIRIWNFESENKYNNMEKRAIRALVFGCLATYVLEEVLLYPHHLLLLLQDSLFNDLDELLWPRPGVVLQARVEAGKALQLLLLRPTHPHKLVLQLHTRRQLPARTGNRKEAVLRRWVW